MKRQATAKRARPTPKSSWLRSHHSTKSATCRIRQAGSDFSGPMPKVGVEPESADESMPRSTGEGRIP